MILLVTAGGRERTAFAALCAHSGRLVVECESVRSATRSLYRSTPRVIVARHKLDDGFSDDIISLLAESGQAPATKIIVLVTAGATASTEARQLELGADCVLRDPVRGDILLAYISKYYRSYKPPAKRAPSKERILYFAGGTFRPSGRLLSAGSRETPLTPREAALVEALIQSRGEVVTYDTLYAEILGRRFYGETSNMRVLLGKLGITASRVGLSVRDWLEVVPKLGYRYRAPKSVPSTASCGAARP